MIGHWTLYLCRQYYNWRPHITHIIILYTVHLIKHDPRQSCPFALHRNIVWPGGYRPAPATTHRNWTEEGEGEGEGEEEGEGEGERAEAVRCLLARAKLIGSIPDELRTLLGTNPTSHGMARCACGGCTHTHTHTHTHYYCWGI